MATKYLYLIRHGQYDLDKKSPEYGSLNKLGFYQAGQVAQRLQEYPIRKIHCSSMKRAKETAQFFKAKFYNLDIKAHHLLKEGLPYVPADIIREKRLDKTQIKVDRARMQQAYDIFFKKNVKNEDVHQVLVCHGNIIRFFICKALGVPIEAWSNFEIHHCSLTIIKVKSNGKKVVSCVGEIGHIPVHKRTIV